MVLWAIIGDNGLVVRSGRGLQSKVAPERLEFGALVEQVEKFGDRVHYKLLSGVGPSEGWVSTRTQEKVLAERMAKDVGVPQSFFSQSPKSRTYKPETALRRETNTQVPMAAACAHIKEASGTLKQWPAPGDNVLLLDKDTQEWVSDCIVQEVIIRDTWSGKMVLPSGSTLVRIGNENRWVTPAEQATALKQLPRPMGLDLNIGNAVMVWSMSGSRWFNDGLVRSRANEDIILQTAHIREGSVLVVYSEGKGVKWIPMEEQPLLLRRMPMDEQIPIEMVAAVVSRSFTPDRGPSAEIVVQPMLSLVLSEDLVILTAYGELFGYIYGRKQDGDEGWFPGSYVGLAAQPNEVDELEEEAALTESPFSEGGQHLKDETPVIEAGGEGDANSLSRSPAVQDEVNKALSERFHTEIEQKDLTSQALSSPKKYVNGMEPKLAASLAKQQAKLQSGADACNSAAVACERKNSVTMEPALAVLLRRQLRKCEGNEDRVSLKNPARVQTERRADAEEGSPSCELDREANDTESPWSSPEPKLKRQMGEKKQVNERIRISDAGLAKKLEQQRAKIGEADSPQKGS